MPPRPRPSASEREVAPRAPSYAMASAMDTLVGEMNMLVDGVFPMRALKSLNPNAFCVLTSDANAPDRAVVGGAHDEPCGRRVALAGGAVNDPGRNATRQIGTINSRAIRIIVPSYTGR